MFRASSMLLSKPYYMGSREMYPYLSVAAGIAYITMHTIMSDNTQQQNNQAIRNEIQELREEVRALRHRPSSAIPSHTFEE